MSSPSQEQGRDRGITRASTRATLLPMYQAKSDTKGHQYWSENQVSLEPTAPSGQLFVDSHCGPGVYIERSSFPLTISPITQRAFQTHPQAWPSLLWLSQLARNTHCNSCIDSWPVTFCTTMFILNCPCACVRACGHVHVHVQTEMAPVAWRLSHATFQRQRAGSRQQLRRYEPWFPSLDWWQEHLEQSDGGCGGWSFSRVHHSRSKPGQTVSRLDRREFQLTMRICAQHAFSVRESYINGTFTVTNQPAYMYIASIPLRLQLLPQSHAARAGAADRPVAILIRQFRKPPKSPVSKVCVALLDDLKTLET